MKGLYEVNIQMLYFMVEIGNRDWIIYTIV